MRAPSLVLAAGLVAVAVVVLTRDPEEPWAVAVVILGLAAAAGAGAVMLQVRRRGGDRRRRAPAPVRAVVARRGLMVAAAVALLLWLRAVDGLSLITAAFVLATFAVTEIVLSARPASSR